MTDPDVIARVDEMIRERGAEYERLVADRRERGRARKRRAGKEQTVEQRERESTRKREARKRQTPEQRQRDKERKARRQRRKARPFMAVDGEGGGTDALGRQDYLLMVASDHTAEQEYVLHQEG